MTYHFHTHRQYRHGLVSPVVSPQVVGNSAIAENTLPTSLNSMWSAYRRSHLESVEICSVSRPKPYVVALVLVYGLEISYGLMGSATIRVEKP